MPNHAFNADSLQRGICFANITTRRKIAKKLSEATALPKLISESC